MPVTLPDSTRAALDELTSSLRQIFKDDLVSVIVHGSAARGEFVPDESDVDLVIVIRNDTLETLEAAGKALLLARFSSRIEGILMSESEVSGASDVFPLMYRDIAEEGVAIVGKNVFASFEPKREHVRLRIEQELREARMRLRRSVAEGRGDEALLHRVLEAKKKQLRSPLRATLTLLGEAAPRKLQEILDRIAERYRVARAETIRDEYTRMVLLIDRTLSEIDTLSELRGPQGGAH
jgi:predicted nucleotidyltransferase